jgi:hypothetical protein
VTGGMGEGIAISFVKTPIKNNPLLYNVPKFLFKLVTKHSQLIDITGNCVFSLSLATPYVHSLPPSKGFLLTEHGYT